MKSFAARVNGFLRSYVQVVAASLALILAMDMMVAVRETSKQQAADAAAAITQNGTGATPGGKLPGTASSSARPTAGKSSASSTRLISKLAGYKPGTYVPGLGTIPLGIDFKNRIIRLAYYWKGYDTATSGGQASAALDEATAFWRYVQWINAHSDESPNRNCSQAGNTCFMGYPFNLHGFKIDMPCIRPKDKNGNDMNVWGDCVVQAGEDTNGWGTAAIKVRDIAKPFAAVSSHGGLSDYGCPILAEAHIFNPVTYNIYSGLTPGTNGYCLPQGFAWEREVKLTLSWLGRQNKTQYCENAVSCRKRVYGILFAEYQGESASVRRFAKQLRDKGINLGRRANGSDSIYSVSTSISQAGQDASTIAGYFKADGVNTILAPDSGAEITFTTGAVAQNYHPDYYVWPCSGEDAAGQVRLYDAHQWTRASGLSCYDKNWDLDLNLDDNARSTQWFHQFQEIACPSGSATCPDPPSTSPLVYQGILPVLVGLTAAGPDITMEKFFAGLHSFQSYRYNATSGQTSDPSHFLLTEGSPDGSQIGDVAEVVWNPTGGEKSAGNQNAPGGYDYSTKRYNENYEFS